jgi:hypothetical protein
MTTEEDEPIVLVGSGDFRIELSRETRALVWTAVRRGLASSPEEFITRALDRWMEQEKLKEVQSEAALGSEGGQEQPSSARTTHDG